MIWNGDRHVGSLGKEILVFRMFRTCIVCICLERGILTLLVHWNHIDEDCQVVRVVGGVSTDATM